MTSIRNWNRTGGQFQALNLRGNHVSCRRRRTVTRHYDDRRLCADRPARRSFITR